MDAEDRYSKSILAASLNAEQAFNAVFADEYAHYPEDQKKLWAAAALLQCDILRYLIAYDTATREGVVRLLWIGDIGSMLYEAREWLFRTGIPELLRICSSKGHDPKIIQAAVKQLKKDFPLEGVSSYADYRNKVGHHYDPDFVAHLRHFSESDGSNFHQLLRNYANFANGWVALCKDVLATPPKA